jgi:hypothetical protein
MPQRKEFKKNTGSPTAAGARRDDGGEPSGVKFPAAGSAAAAD